MYAKHMGEFIRMKTAVVQMAIQTPYPQAVVLTDGSMIQITDDDWRRRRLVVETDRSEAEVRSAFAADGFRPTVLEFVKDGQLGRGMVRKLEGWQVHVRFYRNGRHIQIDGEVEVSNSYVEHLVHGWVSGFTTCADIIGRHFGRYWAYHKGYRKYVSSIINESVLRLDEPQSKTSVAAMIVGAVLLAVAVAVLRDR